LELRDGESKESVSLLELAFCGKTEFKTELDPLVEAANFGLLFVIRGELFDFDAVSVVWFSSELAAELFVFGFVLIGDEFGLLKYGDRTSLALFCMRGVERLNKDLAGFGSISSI